MQPVNPKPILALRILALLLSLSVSPGYAPSASADPLTVRLGATLPLTGRLAEAGKDTQRGIELALEEFQTPDLRLQVFYQDNQYEIKQAVTTAQKLLEQDQVNAIISIWDMADPIAPLTEQQRVLHFAIRWNPEIADRFEHTFTVESTYQSYVHSMLALLKAQKVETIALLTEESQGWLLAEESFRKEAAQFGIQVVASEQLLSTDTEYRGPLLRILREKPQMILLLSNPPCTQLAIRQIRNLAPNQKFTGYFEILDDPNLVEGIPFVSQFQLAPWFEEKFRKRFQDSPKARSAQAYDIVHVIVETAKKLARIPSPADIVETLKTKPFENGAAGRITLTGKHTLENDCVWKITRAGKFVLYDLQER